MSAKPLLDAFRDYLSLREEAEVRDWLGGFDWRLSERSLKPEPLPPVRHLPAVAPFLGKAETRLGRAFIDHAPGLQWLRSYGPEDFGQHFFDNYAHVELIGTRGHFASSEIAAGLVLYGPNVVYPDHWHVAEEIYIPLTGNGWWSRDGRQHEKRRAGDFIFHESNMKHAIRTDAEPMLALWVWRGGDLAQKGSY